MTKEINVEQLLKDLREGNKKSSDLSYAEAKSLVKQPTFATPNRMYIGSGHKTFDKQTTLITTGNIWGSTVFSSYIRSYNEQECNGRTNPKGHLQEFDLKPFKKFEGSHFPMKFVRDLAMDESVILYVFFSHNGEQRMVHGYIITDKNYRHIKTIPVPQSNKSFDILEAVEPYVSYKL